MVYSCSGKMTELGGIFIEFDRWLKNLKINPKGLLYIGNQNKVELFELKEKGIPYVRKLIIDNQFKTLSILKNLDMSAFNIMIINMKDREYDLVSEGLPDMDVVVVRSHVPDYTNLNRLETFVSFMGYLGYAEAYRAEFKKEFIIDLLFTKSKK